MTNEEKQVLLKDLSARLPYGVKVNFRGNIEVLHEAHIYQSVQTLVGESGTLYDINMPNVKPYLRPLSSMTEEEQHEYDNLRLDNLALPKVHLYYPMRWHTMDYLHVDWLNANYFDYRIVPSTGKTLIESDLALEAPKDMYKTE